MARIAGTCKDFTELELIIKNEVPVNAIIKKVDIRLTQAGYKYIIKTIDPLPEISEMPPTNHDKMEIRATERQMEAERKRAMLDKVEEDFSQLPKEEEIK